MLKKITMLAPKGSKCRPGYAMKPEYITIHNTGNTSKTADADNHAKYLQGSGKNLEVSYHWCVDDVQAVNIIPENENAWHAGDGGNGTGNRKSLAIEICENEGGDLKKATDNAVELTRELMAKYNIPISKVVTHKHWSGKQCPRRLLSGEPYSWESFLAKLKGTEDDELREKYNTLNACADAFYQRIKAAVEIYEKGV